MDEIGIYSTGYKGVTLTKRAEKCYPIVVATFCALLLLSNILAVKPIEIGGIVGNFQLGPLQIWPLIFDGGAILFPITYILDDILAEIYGFKKARRTIFVALAIQIAGILMITIVAALPAPSTWDNSEAFSAILGYVPRIVIASLSAFCIGELLNAFALVKIREKTGENKLWVRLLGSTVIGEAADTLTFCTIAFIGTISFPEFLNYVIVGYLFKCGLEVVLLPITYRVIKYLRN